MELCTKLVAKVESLETDLKSTKDELKAHKENSAKVFNRLSLKVKKLKDQLKQKRARMVLDDDSSSDDSDDSDDANGGNSSKQGRKFGKDKDGSSSQGRQNEEEVENFDMGSGNVDMEVEEQTHEVVQTGTQEAEEVPTVEAVPTTDTEHETVLTTFMSLELSAIQNDRDDLGKLKAKADIGIFVGYCENSKGFRI